MEKIGRMNICICIMNYNNNNNALLLAEKFSEFSDFVFITDSGSDEQHWLFRKTHTQFYRGNLDKASSLFINTNCKGCLYICSDVIISTEMIQLICEHINNLPNDVLLYTPVVNGKSHRWLKKSETGFRDIPFAEGMIFYAEKQLIHAIYNLYPNEENKLGWGLDMWWAYVAKYKLNGKVVIDDDCYVLHPDGTDYSTDEALNELKRFISSKEDGFKIFCKQVLGIVS